MKPLVEPRQGNPDDNIPALLEAASGGDQSAWREIVAMYARRVYALIRSRCGSHDVAEEVTQSVFVTVATKLSSGQYTELGRFEPWLFRVAVNRARDEQRRLRRHAAPVDPATFSASRDEREPEDPDAPHQIEKLRDALSRLGDDDREVIELRHHAGLSFRQMADLLEQPIGTLLARHHRALRKLRDMMTAEPASHGGNR